MGTQDGVRFLRKDGLAVRFGPQKSVIDCSNGNSVLLHGTVGGSIPSWPTYMPEDFKIKPADNKSRFGYRGSKKRYSVFRAEWNQKWLPLEKEEFEELCTKHNLEQTQFFKETDGRNRKYSYALRRCRKHIKEQCTDSSEN